MNTDISTHTNTKFHFHIQLLVMHSLYLYNIHFRCIEGKESPFHLAICNGYLDYAA